MKFFSISSLLCLVSTSVAYDGFLDPPTGSGRAANDTNLPEAPGNTTGSVACSEGLTLENGAVLSAAMVSPLEGATIPASSIRPDGIDFLAMTSIKKGLRDHFTYVLDISGSTGYENRCGDRTILECEKEAILALHNEIEDEGTVVDYGLSTFGTTATTFEFASERHVTTDRDALDGEMSAAVNGLTDKGWTNFAAGLRAAEISVGETTAPDDKFVIFLSDGESNRGGDDFSAALEAMKALGAKVFSFAVGSRVSCTSGTDGTLQEMADYTGGLCTKVEDPTDLGNVLSTVFSSKMISTGLSIDGVPVDGASHTNVAPFDGPGEDQISYTAPPSSLTVGSHEVCVRATGLAPPGISTSGRTASCCVTFEIVADTCSQGLTLDNGAHLSAAITTALGGAVLPASGIPPEGIDLVATTSIGEAEQRLDHWSYVIDVSGSTGYENRCGNRTIIECEKEAILARHQKIEESGSAVDYGVSTFGTRGKTIQFPSGNYVTTDRDEFDGEMTTAVNEIQVSGWTNFAVGLRAAAVSLDNSTATGNKYVIFFSDGKSNRGGDDFPAAVEAIKERGATIYSFAIGRYVTCTGGTNGTLQEMADATGGICTRVADTTELDDVLTNTFSTTMMSTKLMLDGKTLDGASHTNPPTFEGPGDDQLAVKIPRSDLSVGTHTACIEATGLGTNLEEMASCCLSFEVVADGCSHDVTLANGAQLSAEITTGLDGAILPASTTPMDILGTAAIANNGRNDHWSYVIDISGSTGYENRCGNRTILECEKEAIHNLHEEIEDANTAVDYGLSTFGTTGKTIQFPSGAYVTTDRYDVDGEMGAEINGLTDKGWTNFAAGLRAAALSVGVTTAPGNKYVIFLSDGQSNRGGDDFQAALDDIKNLEATVFSFAVGSRVTCTGGTDGTLQEMADFTGGVCTKVDDAAELGDVLSNFFSTQMTTTSLSIDGNNVDMTHSNVPPFDGPGVDELTLSSTLAAGSHTACVSATALGPANEATSQNTAECCVTFDVAGTRRLRGKRH